MSSTGYGTGRPASAGGENTLDLAGLRAAARQLLAAGLDPESWPDDTIDAGVREALREYVDAAPPAEATITVAASGAEQDLSAVPGLYRVLALAWPWCAGAAFAPLARRWVPLGERAVRFEGCEPQAGDALRVRYRRWLAVKDLDGATQTTVPAADARLLARGAAGWAANARCRALMESESTGAAVAKDLWAWQALSLAEFHAGLQELAGAAADVCWGL